MPLDHSLQTAIVGAGPMGLWHARYASRWSRIAYVADPNQERADELARKFPGALPLATLSECLNRGGIDVVHVCAPVNLHFKLSRQALEAGAHVLVEKPAAETAEQTEGLLDLARTQSKRFGRLAATPLPVGLSAVPSTTRLARRSGPRRVQRCYRRRRRPRFGATPAGSLGDTAARSLRLCRLRRSTGVRS